MSKLRISVRGCCPVLLDEVRRVRARLHRAAHLAVHDLGPDSALAGQHAAFDQVVDGVTHGGPRHTQSFGEIDFVGQLAADGQLAALDQLLQTARHLVVQRNRTVPVERDIRH